jgi:hypothetical protein
VTTARRAYRAKWAREHREKSRAWDRAHSTQKEAARRAWINALKRHPCKSCRKRYPPYVMQFDHVRGRKSFMVNTATRCSRAKILREIKKCDLVCANCHAKRTWRRMTCTTMR